MEAVIESLTNEGYMVTSKRVQIIDYLWEKTEINDIEALWLEIRRIEHISWATMYTTIKLLHKLGWLELHREHHRKNVYRWAKKEDT